MKDMNLLLIRHATNDWVGKRLPGWTPGIHLNEAGRAQAEALARRLAHAPLAAIYASPLERTVETAEALAQPHGLRVELRAALRDTDPGVWTGRALDDLRLEALWPALMVHPAGVRLPGGESLREVQSRIVAELDRIREAHPGQTVAVVFHADPIKMAVAHYMGLAFDLFQRLEIGPASVTALALTRYGARLVCLNYTDSLPAFQMDQEGDTNKEPADAVQSL
jgi:probable phosphoglycerate mutase